VAETDDVTACKKACEKGQLKGKGIGAFVQRGGKTVFKQCTHAEAIAAKAPAKGAKMFIIGDPEASANLRLMQAVEGEGLPRLKSPFEHGNLFLILNIEFPTTLPAAAAAQLLKVLPPPKHVPTVSEDSDDVEVVTLKAIDPVKSYKEHLAAQPEPDDDDDDDGPGGQRVQCAQQ
jgi:DnaJ family protein A protein 2